VTHSSYIISTVPLCLSENRPSPGLSICWSCENQVTALPWRRATQQVVAMGTAPCDRQNYSVVRWYLNRFYSPFTEPGQRSMTSPSMWCLTVYTVLQGPCEMLCISISMYSTDITEYVMTFSSSGMCGDSVATTGRPRPFSS
jgi:hypothetical protein